MTMQSIRVAEEGKVVVVAKRKIEIEEDWLVRVEEDDVEVVPVDIDILS
ncbi:hypothetical protein A2U01_0116621, partial [Trifolium medium]|nr:hypothetical protein [Trifolium medium]